MSEKFGWEIKHIVDSIQYDNNCTDHMWKKRGNEEWYYIGQLSKEISMMWEKLETSFNKIALGGTVNNFYLTKMKYVCTGQRYC